MPVTLAALCLIIVFLIVGDAVVKAKAEEPQFLTVTPEIKESKLTELEVRKKPLAAPAQSITTSLGLSLEEITVSVFPEKLISLFPAPV